jgi:hypothetical protein
MSKRKKIKNMDMSYGEWVRKERKEQKRLRDLERLAKHAYKRTLEVIRRFEDRPIKYNRSGAKIISRMCNPMLVKRDGVFQQRAKYTITFRTKYGVVVLTTKTRGIDVQRTRKIRNSRVRESYELDAFTIDTSNVSLPACEKACLEYESEMQVLLANHFARTRVKYTEAKIQHDKKAVVGSKSSTCTLFDGTRVEGDNYVPTRLEHWQSRKKRFK